MALQFKVHLRAWMAYCYARRLLGAIAPMSWPHKMDSYTVMTGY